MIFQRATPPAALPLEPLIIGDELAHEIGVFERDEVYKFYASERRKHCTMMEIMDLWLVVPYCFGCAVAESFDGIVDPYIRPAYWEDDLCWHVGDSVVAHTKTNLRCAIDFAFSCKRCGTQLRPWNGDEMSVARLHVEERFSIPLETPGHRRPSHDLAKLVKQFYGRRCFGCSKQENKKDGVLHIDHIFPQSNGGTAAFRNLQPLCERCGNAKGNSLPDEVDVCSTIYFGTPPSDAYVGLFW